MNRFEQIEAYLSGEMNEDEKASFESLLLQDPGLKKDFDQWVQTEAIVAKQEAAAAGLPGLKSTLEPLTRAYFGRQGQKAGGKVISIKKYMMAAVAAAAVVLIFFLLPGSLDSFEVAPMPGAVVRGETDAGKKGAQLFNESKYEEALPYLKQEAASKPGDATANFYYGITLLKTEQATEALQVFEQLARGNSVYKEDSYFFAAFASYKIDKKSLAAEYAGKVPESSTYYKKAQQILKRAK